MPSLSRAISVMLQIEFSPLDSIGASGLISCFERHSQQFPMTAGRVSLHEVELWSGGARYRRDHWAVPSRKCREATLRRYRPGGR